MEQFTIEPNDKGLVISLKREINVLLQADDNLKKICFEDVIKVAKAFESIEVKNGEEITDILYILNKYWTYGVLSPLTLKDEEFNSIPDIKGLYHNIRYTHICKDTNGVMFNNNAYNTYVRAKYSHPDNKQIQIQPYIYQINERIYISKGGCINGTYIQDCIIPRSVIDKHSFNVEDIITIPVCFICNGHDFIQVADHRDPELKKLMNKYEVHVSFDEDVADKNYNIRKYIKLNKKL